MPLIKTKCKDTLTNGEGTFIRCIHIIKAINEGEIGFTTTKKSMVTPKKQEDKKEVVVHHREKGRKE